MKTVISLNDIYQDCGWVEHRLQLPKARDWWSDPHVGSLISAEGGVLIVRWREPFLTLRLSEVTPAASRAARGSEPTVRFSELTRADELANLLNQRFRRSAKFAGNYFYRGGEIFPDTCLECVFLINTSAPEFREAVSTSTVGNGQLLTVEVAFILVQKGHCGTEQQSASIELRLSPLGYPPPYQGVLAVDFGNTHTNVASVDARCLPSTSHIALLPDLQFDRDPLNDRRGLSDQTPIVSFLRIDAVTNYEECSVRDRYSPQQLLGQLEAYAYRTGTHTNMWWEPPHGFLANPKRAAVAPPGKVKHVILTRGDEHFPARTIFERRPDYEVELPGSRPAELFLSRLLEGFRGLHRAWPSKLAVTYPSTYSAGELARLREAVYQAWRWAERHNPHRHLSQDEVIHLLIDEASAAAFYYLARWVLEGPGGLRSFRWYYPDGFYLLVYDCGGATTDVSLVKAEAPKPDLFRLTVLGRTGMRDFAGDDITVAVFLLLKAKLAEKLAERRGESVPRVPSLGVSNKALAGAHNFRVQLLNEENLQLWDRFVPVDYPRGVVGRELLARQELRMVMWQWAEEVKKRLAAGEDPTKGMPGFGERLQELLGNVTSEIFGQIRVTVQEVNALVEDKVRRSVELCRKLLDSRLAFRLGQPDDIFLVGQASLYPLIGQMLRQAFLGEPPEPATGPGVTRRPFSSSLMGLEGSFGPSDLKDCVAKGAALALALRQGGLGLNLEFDTDLCRRLPFSVAWHDAAANTYVLLYSEGERYEDLEPKVINLTIPEGVDRPTWIRLAVRWPGAEYEPFLIFEFPDGVEGPVVISFDIESEQFIATAEHTGYRAIGERDVDVDIYRAALQREKIRLLDFSNKG